MIVDNPVEFAHQKFANLCDHLEQKYAFDVPAMRAVPATALFVLLKQHLLPHAALVEAGCVSELVAAIHNEDISALANLCEDDDKVLRYLKLFCMLVAQFASQAHHALSSSHGHHIAVHQKPQPAARSPPPKRPLPEMMDPRPAASDPEKMLAQKQKKIAAHNARIQKLNNSKAKEESEEEDE